MSGEHPSHAGKTHAETGSASQVSYQPRRSSRRYELQIAFLEATRKTGSLMQLMGQAAADQIGINATDLNCLNILGFTGTMTAGQLAKATGLTTASITGVIDRLEVAGYAHRGRDPRDRRRVVIHLAADAALRKVAPVFAPVIAAWQEIAASYTEAELELIVRFQRRGEEALRQQLTLMRSPHPGTSALPVRPVRPD
jgi:DNA-binding MarR family transcriptional regulator